MNGRFRLVFLAWAVCLVIVVPLLSMLPTRLAAQSQPANTGQLSDGGIAADIMERFVRVARVRSNGMRTSARLPLWGEADPYPLPEAMVTPWPIIRMVQDGPPASILFDASKNLPPSFIVWLWHEQPSAHYLVFNWQRLGLSERGQSSVMTWGVARSPPEPRTTCHWWTEKSAGNEVADVLLVDALQSAYSIGCLAAGLLRHLGNPLWQHMAQESFGAANASALPKVKRLYDCAVRSELEFVRGKSPMARNVEDMGKYLDRLDRRVRRDCLTRA